MIQESLKAQLRDQKTALGVAFAANANVASFTSGLSTLTDQALQTLWRQFSWHKDAALLAVGGYGRAELFPSSDVDLLWLMPSGCSDPTLKKMQDQISTMVSQCWDIGLDIGHSVRTVDECIDEAQQDITIQTSLLESRLLAGSRSATKQLSMRLSQARDPQHFFQAKLLEMRQRHAKFEDTPYSLEPNLKESPGGLRDLQIILWIARAANLGSTWAQMAGNGLMTQREARLLTRLTIFMKRLRIRLHFLARRREDRVVFDMQAPLARLFNIEHPSDRRASELLMQRYYLTAKQITQTNALVLQALEARLFPSNTGTPERLDDEFTVVRGLLDINDEQLFETNPPAILRAFLRLAQHRELTGMTARTLHAIWRSRSRIDAKFRKDAGNRALFMQLLKEPRGVTHVFRRMNEWSVLGRYIPAFRRIVGRMQHDLFHVYTVDQHILMVVRNLRRFAIAEHAHEFPFCSELMAQFDKPWLLYLAALFHDIAKGRGGDHSKLGTVDAKRFGVQHALSKDEVNLLCFLVEHHLTMSSVAQKQDLSDPAVVEQFAQLVQTPYRLSALYLLTVADIRGTSPKVWNGWKAKLLEELFRKAKRVMVVGATTQEGELDRVQREARVTLALYGLSEQLWAPLWKQFDISYFLRHDAQEIAWQTRSLWRHVDTDVPLVRCRLSPHGEGFQVVVYTPDKADLFARICAYFDRQNFSVLDARVYTTLHHYALDSFMVTATNFEDRYRDILQLVEHDLAACLTLGGELGNPVRGRPSRRSRYFPLTPRVEMRPDDRAQHYLLSISATDRTGLLFSIAKVMAQHHVNLQMARISTLGERVEDTFLIDGPSLANQREQLLFEEDLLAAIQP